MSTRTPAQKAAWAKLMAARKAKAAGPRKASRAPARNRYPTVRGRGGYAEDWSRTGSEWGGKFGGLAGGVADLASSIASKVGPVVEGLGVYKVRQNSLMTIPEGMGPPTVRNAKDGRFIIRHREYIRDIVCPANNGGAFVVQPFKINPGLQSTFPWLSTVAQNFQQYRIRGMLFEFKSNYSEYNSAQAGMGTVILATEYDATLPPFTTKIDMENHQYAMSAKPSASQLHPIECDRGTAVLNELYVRQTVPDDNNDLRFSDFGTFQVAHVGIPNSDTPINLGEIWVSFEIELLKPQLAGAGSLILSSYFTNTEGLDFDHIFGTLSTMEQDPNNEVALNFDYSSTNATITVRDNIGSARLYFSMLYVYESAVARTSPSIAAVSGCSIPTQVWGDWSNWQAPGNAESSSRQIISFYIDTDGTGPAIFTFHISFGNFPIWSAINVTVMDSKIGTSPLVPYQPFTLAAVPEVRRIKPSPADYFAKVEEEKKAEEKPSISHHDTLTFVETLSASTRERVKQALALRK